LFDECCSDNGFLYHLSAQSFLNEYINHGHHERVAIPIWYTASIHHGQQDVKVWTKMLVAQSFYFLLIGRDSTTITKRLDKSGTARKCLELGGAGWWVVQDCGGRRRYGVFFHCENKTDHVR
jgi:hypothetical protein